jgi:hypothetical protein
MRNTTYSRHIALSSTLFLLPRPAIFIPCQGVEGTLKRSHKGLSDDTRSRVATPAQNGASLSGGEVSRDALLRVLACAASTRRQ